MVLVHKNKDGYIYAILEWDVVDINGKTQNNGKYAYIRDLWIHKDYSSSFHTPLRQALYMCMDR